jgi:hypothetical protein
MKRVITAIAAASAVILANPSFARDAGAPAAPPLSAAQAQQVQSELDAYRRETDARVARGDITHDEAQRLVQWRQWQLAQQAAGLAPPPPPERVAVVPRGYPLPPPPAYPYPYYYPAPYYAPWWGVSVCAGRAYRHGFGSFCI